MKTQTEIIIILISIVDITSSSGVQRKSGRILEEQKILPGRVWARTGPKTAEVSPTPARFWARTRKT